MPVHTCIMLLWSLPLIVTQLSSTSPAHAHSVTPGYLAVTSSSSVGSPAMRAPPAPQVRVGPEDGLNVSSADGNFALRFGALIQTRYEARWFDGRLSASSFEMRAARPQIRGHIFRPWIRFFVQPEIANMPRLLDLQIDVQPSEAIGLRIGQFLTPFSREFMTPGSLLQFPDYAVANSIFRADRDTGAVVYGTPFGGRFEYYAGVFNGNGINRNGNDNRSMLWMGRIVLSPLGRVEYTETPGLTPGPFRFSIGLNAYYNTVTLTEQVVDPMTSMLATHRIGDQNIVTGGIDFAMHFGRWMFQAEGYYRRTSGVDGSWHDAWGCYAQTGLFVSPRFELAGRLNIVDLDSIHDGGVIAGAEAQAAYYLLGNHLKIALRYMALYGETTTPVTPAGTSHGLTLQGQVWF